MNGQELQETEEEVDIGVMVTKDLKPAGQCQRAAKTAQTVLGQQARAFTYREWHIFMKLYVQYVRPHLEFSVQSPRLKRSGTKTVPGPLPHKLDPKNVFPSFPV